MGGVCVWGGGALCRPSWYAGWVGASGAGGLGWMRACRDVVAGEERAWPVCVGACRLACRPAPAFAISCEVPMQVCWHAGRMGVVRS